MSPIDEEMLERLRIITIEILVKELNKISDLNEEKLDSIVGKNALIRNEIILTENNRVENIHAKTSK